ncbi:MAG: SHOCT domain-containing protein [Methanobrevibacter sp.]|nr:SHOCT domain-containing protein [Candidatus Methanovirga procula]
MFPLKDIEDIEFSSQGQHFQYAGAFNTFMYGGMFANALSNKDNASFTLTIVLKVGNPVSYNWTGSNAAINSLVNKLTAATKFLRANDNAPAAAAPVVDVVAQLKDAKELLDAGVLTDEEFQALKSKLLN